MRMNWVRRNRPQLQSSPQRLLRRRRWLVLAALASCLAAPLSAESAGTTTSASAAIAPLNCAPPGVKRPPCYSPRAYQVAYGVAPLLRRGINGRGETVVVPELASSPPSMDIRKDLTTFDRTFGLPPAKLHVVNTSRGRRRPTLPTMRKSKTPRWCTRSRPAPPSRSFSCLRTAMPTARSSSQPRRPSSYGPALACTRPCSRSAPAPVSTSSPAPKRPRCTRRWEAPAITVSPSLSPPATSARSATAAHPSRSACPPPTRWCSRSAAPSSTRPGPAAPTWARWPGTAAATAPPAATAACSPGPSYQDGVTRAAKRGVPDVAANADSATAMALEYSDHELRAATGRAPRPRSGRA